MFVQQEKINKVKLRWLLSISHVFFIFASWRVGKLERRYIFKGTFLKHNNLKSKIYFYNTYKNKLHQTTGA